MRRLQKEIRESGNIDPPSTGTIHPSCMLNSAN
jgi:hypothetical protein